MTFISNRALSQAAAGSFWNMNQSIPDTKGSGIKTQCLIILAIFLAKCRCLVPYLPYSNSLGELGNEKIVGRN